jgi:chromosome segregation protein
LVTLAGELVRGASLVVIGPRAASGGLVSRRSELRVLREQIAELVTKLVGAAAGIEQLEKHIVSEETRVATLTDHHQAAVSRLSEHRVERNASQERRREVRRRKLAIERQLELADIEWVEIARQRDANRDRLETLESDLARIELQTARVAEESQREQQGFKQRDDQITNSKVELAKSEERLANLREQFRQVETHQRDREAALTEVGQQLSQCRTRCADASRAILRAGSEIAELYLSKERFAREVVVRMRQRQAFREQHTVLAEEVQAARATIHSLEERHHQQDLAASEIRFQRETVASRLRDDYGIELAELEHEPTDEERHQREEVEEEIAELRRKINNIGNVNLESLAELEDIEQRHQSLSTQNADLVQAKESLERIIHKINADSRRLFSETLESVKVHFQDLFRKLFGGGHADIVLEDDVDLLECGIEIVARPPGKEPRSISLLSGGEKTLTCVALLLALFRNRPSPFCILDEVDAALDEANISRFISVLEEFLAWTHFIVVTHSKKTMTCANTLYGVTMQESGVSARVSVHFDDVREDGQFDVRPSAATVDEAAARTDDVDNADDEVQAA